MRVGKKEPQPGVTLATDREEDESRVDTEEVNGDEGFSRSKKIKKPPSLNLALLVLSHLHHLPGACVNFLPLSQRAGAPHPSAGDQKY